MTDDAYVKMPAAPCGKKGSRRDFLRNSAITAIAGTALERMHEVGIKAFPAKTAGKGNQLMQLRHVQSDHGMFGMVTALIVK